MTSEEITKLRKKNTEDEHEERSRILESHIKKFHNLKKELEDICERDTGHYFQKAYYRWGDFDERRYTHESFACKYCRKLIHVPESDVDNVNINSK